MDWKAKRVPSLCHREHKRITPKLLLLPRSVFHWTLIPFFQPTQICGVRTSFHVTQRNAREGGKSDPFLCGCCCHFHFPWRCYSIQYYIPLTWPLARISAALIHFVTFYRQMRSCHWEIIARERDLDDPVPGTQRFVLHLFLITSFIPPTFIYFASPFSLKVCFTFIF